MISWSGKKGVNPGGTAFYCKYWTNLKGLLFLAVRGSLSSHKRGWAIFRDSDGTERTENSTFFNASTKIFSYQIDGPHPFYQSGFDFGDFPECPPLSVWHLKLNCVHFEHLVKFFEVSLPLTLGFKRLIWPSKLVISWNESVILRNSHPVL